MEFQIMILAVLVALIFVIVRAFVSYTAILKPGAKAATDHHLLHSTSNQGTTVWRVPKSDEQSRLEKTRPK